MKLSIDQKELAKAVGIVNKFIPGRPTHPILANILIKATDKLTLTSFNLSSGIELECAANIEEVGEITVDAKLFTAIISKTSGMVMLSLEDKQLVINTEVGEYTISTLSAEEFPELPTVNGDKVALPDDHITLANDAVAFAASLDETKQVLTGISVHLTDDFIEFAATDGHRLAVASVGELEPETAYKELVLPVKALKEVENFSNVELTCNEGWGAFSTEGAYMVFRLLEGQYPSYSTLMPRSFDRQATVNRKALLGALQRISVLSDRKNNIVKAELNSGTQTISLSVEATDIGQGYETLNAQVTGTSLITAFNVKYITDSVSALSSEEVVIKANSATSPMTVSPLSGANVTHLIMPVQMRN